MKKLFAILLVAGSLFLAVAAHADEAKSGQVTGVVTAKGEDWIEVKADKAKKAERYEPFYTVGTIQDGKGGPPQVGGQYDMGIVEQIKKTATGSHVVISWQEQDGKRRIASIRKK